MMSPICPFQNWGWVPVDFPIVVAVDATPVDVFVFCASPETYGVAVPLSATTDRILLDVTDRNGVFALTSFHEVPLPKTVQKLPFRLPKK